MDRQLAAGAEIAARAERLTRVTGPWSLHFLRWPAALVGGGALVAAALAAIAGSPSVAWGIVIGAFVVAVFFTLSTVAVAKMGEIRDSYTLPTALVVYGIKLLLLGVLLAAMPRQGPVSRIAMGITIAIGAIVWITTHVLVIARTPMLYVDPGASSGPARKPGNGSGLDSAEVVGQRGTAQAGDESTPAD